MADPADKLLTDSDQGLSELRRLLVSSEQERLEVLEDRLDDPRKRGVEVGSILPRAFAARDPADKELRHAIGPVFEEAFKASVRQHPQLIVDVLFPVILPAIRRSVAEALKGMVESLNRILDESFSWRGIQWRIEAIRTGRTFAEVALSKSLLFQVEEVFLIHRETGLLLASASANPAMRDQELVSAMLTAIQDFVRDSLAVKDQNEGLDRLEAAGRVVRLTRGREAAIAAVIRGTPPPYIEEMLDDALAAVHREHAEDWEEFTVTGNTAPFERSQPYLRGCLLAQYQPPTRPSSRKLIYATTAAVVLLAIWLTPRLLREWRFEHYIRALQAEPGIVVTETGSRSGRPWVSGMRDPDSANPAGLLAQAGLSAGDVTEDWEPYLSLHKTIVVRRAAALLSPPASVRLDYSSGTLSGSGEAPHRWIVRARRDFPKLAGVERLDLSQMVDADRRALDSRVARLAALCLPFDPGSSQLNESARRVCDEAAAQLRSIVADAHGLGLAAHVRIVGKADSSGTEQVNERLSVERAGAARNALMTRTIPAALLDAEGAAPANSGGERCVRLQVGLQAAPSSTEAK